MINTLAPAVQAIGDRIDRANPLAPCAGHRPMTDPLRRVRAATVARTRADEKAEDYRRGQAEAIRAALALGVSYRKLQEITGLTRNRLDQIRRGTR